MKIKEAIDYLQFYKKFKEKIKNTAINAIVAYRLTRIESLLAPVQETYYSTVRDIIYKNGELDENGNIKLSEDKNNVCIKPDKIEETNKALIELQESDCGVDIEKYKIELSYFENSQFSLEDMNNFQLIIKD